MENQNTQLVEPHAIESIERAQIDMQIATAKRYPRTLSKVKQDMLSFATLDEETAAACFYTLPRGGKAIQGPSVRLAEIAVACYGNLRAGSRILSTITTGDNPHVIVQSVAHDLEHNTAITIEKRRRITKKKSRDSIDEDDITLACNACSAVAFRDAVFKVVPQALIRPVYEAAKRVAVGEASSLVAKRGKIIDRLKQMGVIEERILSVLEVRKVDDIGLEQLEILIGLGTAIKDGDTTIEEAFPQAWVPKAEATPGPKPPPVEALRRGKDAVPAKVANPGRPPEQVAAEQAQAEQQKPADNKIIDVTSQVQQPANPTQAAAQSPATPAAGTSATSAAPSVATTGGATTVPVEIPPSKLPEGWLREVVLDDQTSTIAAINRWLTEDEMTADELIKWCRGRNLLKAEEGLEALSPAKRSAILKKHEMVRGEIIKARG